MNKVLKVSFVVLGLACVSSANSTTVSSEQDRQNIEQNKSGKLESGSKMLEDFQTYLQQTMGPNMRPGIKNPRCTPFPECLFTATNGRATTQ